MMLHNKYTIVFVENMTFANNYNSYTLGFNTTSTTTKGHVLHKQYSIGSK